MRGLNCREQVGSSGGYPSADHWRCTWDLFRFWAKMNVEGKPSSDTPERMLQRTRKKSFAKKDKQLGKTMQKQVGWLRWKLKRIKEAEWTAEENNKAFEMIEKNVNCKGTFLNWLMSGRI